MVQWGELKTPIHDRRPGRRHLPYRGNHGASPARRHGAQGIGHVALPPVDHRPRPRVWVEGKDTSSGAAATTPLDFFRFYPSCRSVGTLELEGNGQREPYWHGLSILATWGEPGQRLADTNCLTVEILVHRADNLYFTNVTSLLNNELHYDTTLNIVLCRHGRIVDVRLEVLHQRNLTTRELGHLLY